MELKYITDICSVKIRTVYRNLNVLESDLKVPIWQQSKKRGITEGYFLLPINFTLGEAMVLFQTARLMNGHIHLYNPSLISAFR